MTSTPLIATARPNITEPLRILPVTSQGVPHLVWALSLVCAVGYVVYLYASGTLAALDPSTVILETTAAAATGFVVAACWWIVTETTTAGIVEQTVSADDERADASSSTSVATGADGAADLECTIELGDDLLYAATDVLAERMQTWMLDREAQRVALGSTARSPEIAIPLDQHVDDAELRKAAFAVASAIAGEPASPMPSGPEEDENWIARLFADSDDAIEPVALSDDDADLVLILGDECGKEAVAETRDPKLRLVRQTAAPVQVASANSDDGFDTRAFAIAFDPLSAPTHAADADAVSELTDPGDTFAEAPKRDASPVGPCRLPESGKEAERRAA